VPQLIYETTDTDFADRAIEAMRKADIDCYRVGHGYSTRSAYVGRGGTESQVCLYVERDTDCARANEILLELGAVMDDPKLPPRWVVLLLLALATAIGVWVSLEWK
jgi:hypothetical protein